MTEEWRDIPGFEGRYQVSDFGRVRSLMFWSGNVLVLRQEPLVMKTPINAHGYPAVNLRGCPKPRPYEVQYLVCLTFHGPRPSQDHTAAHRDGVKPNCRADNLRWATWAEQAGDRQRHATASGNPNGARRHG